MEFATNDKPINLLDAVAAYRAQAAVIDFITPLADLEKAKAWIEALNAADMMFHFEDSPETIHMYGHGKDHGRLFTDEQAVLVRKRVAELYALDWSPAGHECPIGYALEVMDRDGAL